MPQEVFEKWGFGMAPPKTLMQQNRLIAARYVCSVIDGDADPKTDIQKLEHISTVKGLFTRVFKEDQWDWFTVRGQLGYPSPLIAKYISEQLYSLRRATTEDDLAAFGKARVELQRLPARKCLGAFLGKLKILDESGAGWIYVLSTREYMDLLKIGMTTRSVEERVREINGATGVAIPFGVRGCWRVTQPARAEKLVHELLHANRVRGDREFFRADFQDVSLTIRTALQESDLEIRTIAKLAALSAQA
jgi:T5orf172 domain